MKTETSVNEENQFDWNIYCECVDCSSVHLKGEYPNASTTAEIARLTIELEAAKVWVGRATEFELVPSLPWSMGRTDQRPVNIKSRGQLDGKHKWAVVMQEWVLNKSGEFEWEPMPSSRTEEFIANTRFDSYEEALEAFTAIGTAEGEGK